MLYIFNCLYSVFLMFEIHSIFSRLSVSGYNTTVMRRSTAAGQIQQPVMDNSISAGNGLPQHISLHHYYDCPKFCWANFTRRSVNHAFATITSQILQYVILYINSTRNLSNQKDRINLNKTTYDCRVFHGTYYHNLITKCT